MLITIVTKYDATKAEHYVGAIAGAISPKQREKMKNEWGCGDEPVLNSDLEDEKNEMFFREVQVVDNPEKLFCVLNIDDSNPV